jgi:peptidoglycan/xylan/chitin deacetylase (PgdA/CDA1 family)
MQWLKDNGYQAVTLSEGLAQLNSKITSLSARGAGGEGRGEVGGNHVAPSTRHSTLDTRLVVLTFDDGFRDFYTHALPALQDHGFSATMYLPTAFIGSALPSPAPRRGLEKLGKRRKEFAGGEGPLRAERAGASKSLGQGEVNNPSSGHSSPVTRHNFRGRDCLTWPEVNELHRAGIEFGSHTVHHPELVNLPWPEIESEIRDSKSEIENHLGHPCAAFAYPYAFPQTRRDFVDRFQDLLASSGYETSVTTQLGRHWPGGDALQIKRLPVNSDDDGKLFQAKLAGAYDWLALPQTAIKNIKRCLPNSRKSDDNSVQSGRNDAPALGS